MCECFNCFIPQKLGDDYLGVGDDYDDKPWDDLGEDELRDLP